MGPMLRLVLAVSALAGPLSKLILKHRLRKCKEDPDRWHEKLGEATAKRPDGPLVWLHGVGVGEVMALRGLVTTLARERAELNFLLTSSARSSGQVIAKNLPARTTHQYLPLDLPAPVNSFLNHWRPDVVVWSDQEVWPRMAVQVARRGIPQAYISARITELSALAKKRWGAAFGDLYRLMDLRHAQDVGTAQTLHRLMGDDSTVHVTGTLKAICAPLAFDPDLVSAFQAIMASRRTWLLASSHPADETVALAAHQSICDADPNALLMIVPRDITRADSIAQQAEKLGFKAEKRSNTSLPDASTSVYIADTYGELGTWYRAVDIALIGGTFDATEGHNPWEAVALGTAVLHGPCTGNFAEDFATLTAARGCLPVINAQDIAEAIMKRETMNFKQRASAVKVDMSRGSAQITSDVLLLLDRCRRGECE
jgi:3-deoxy-D-manno-octulosonic-acid transferase